MGGWGGGRLICLHIHIYPATSTLKRPIILKLIFNLTRVTQYDKEAAHTRQPFVSFVLRTTDAEEAEHDSSVIFARLPFNSRRAVY